MFIIKDTKDTKENIKYIYSVLKYLTNLEIYAVGTTIKGISKESLISVNIPIPTNEVQEYIVAQEKVKFYFTFFFAIRGGESSTLSTSS